MYIVAPDTNQDTISLLREDDRGKFDLDVIFIGVQVVHPVTSLHLDAGIYFSGPCFILQVIFRNSGKVSLADGIAIVGPPFGIRPIMFIAYLHEIRVV